MSIKRMVLVGFIAVFGVLLPGRPLWSYCWWNSYMSPSYGRIVPVYISDYKDEALINILHSASGLNQNDLKNAVMTALDIWYEDGQADIRFEFAGLWSKPSGAEPNKFRVVISSTGADSDCSGADACAWHSECSGGQGCRLGFVELQHWQFLGSNNGSKRWGIDPPGANYVGPHAYADIVGTLVHELGHVLGLHHSGECGTAGITSVMNGNSSSAWNNVGEARFLRKDDIDGVVNRYGWRKWHTKYVESADGKNWANGSVSIPKWIWMPDTRFGSVSTGGGEATDSFFMAFPYVHRVNLAKYTPVNGWSITVIDSGPDGITYNPVSLATNRKKGSDAVIFAVWLAGETMFNDNKVIRWMLSDDQGATWAVGYLNSNGNSHTTRRNGVSTGYDPKTNTFIVTWLDNDNMVAFQTVAADTGAMAKPVTYVIEATDAPSIACSDSGSNNCVIALPNVRKTESCPITLHGRINFPTKELILPSQPSSSSCILSASHTPHVTINDNNTQRPFVMSFKIPRLPCCALTFHRAADNSSAWIFSDFVMSKAGLSGAISAPSVGRFDSISTGEYWNIIVDDF